MKKFIRDWWSVFAVLIIMIIARVFIFAPIIVDGHSMDPTLEDGERMIIIKTTKISRFDMVVSNEITEAADGQKSNKMIIKRVIGMPGDTIEYQNDVLYVNGKKTDEPYLKEYQALFKKDRLQKTYSYNEYFQQLAENSSAFTTDSTGNANFKVEVPEGQYYLMGDDRIVSKDSRMIGTVSKSSITGEPKVAFWPLNKLRIIFN
ncbi:MULTISPECIES: signal peptidase I [unclassified Enterococcus]|uniref:signal peptidase I n=1 Tax=unclassified Enterococcus TaxID=2608891 RepID=UPI001557C7B7|nr:MULTISPECIES: signal peptidase I [unclassified Enterococcus]MBS7577411.1 signal peptidase I [Enterococcus sp. MMGLQ5-2]MBS7584818.1 signal peptidase I [Enterococcus sp. MMGLQ5-1]NPD12673.1 signal peptidase I [Enterococcus sp. MMGLQ5-1]NPD37245.1 signal peptidase I [Enterococcus sp. MMGLQ5-2]